MMNLRQRRTRGQTIILLALLLGILMVIAALVIDIGTMSRIRAEEQYVCDSACLAGIAECVNSGSATQGIATANSVTNQDGYVLGQNGITQILQEPYLSTTGAYSETASDRFRTTITRHFSQYFAAVIGVNSEWVQTTATSAVMGTAPIDVSFNGTLGVAQPDDTPFPTVATMSVFGPTARYDFGDEIDTPTENVGYTAGAPNNGRGINNPTYDPTGWHFDLNIPSDLVAATGSSVVRVEIFDPDCINAGNPGNSVWDASTLGPQGAPDPTTGNVDEIRSPDGEGLISTTPGISSYTFAQCSTQTQYSIYDHTGALVAQAQYGPTSNTPFYFQDQDPSSSAANVPGAGDTAQAITDLHWVTPTGFQFDTSQYVAPFSMQVVPLAGSSENGYSLRVGPKRANGTNWSAAADTATPNGTFNVFGNGRVETNIDANSQSANPSTYIPITMPMGSVPPGTTSITLGTFDQDNGARYQNLGMQGINPSTQNPQPMLWPAPANTAVTNPMPADIFGMDSNNNPVVVQDNNGNKWFTTQKGNMSSNAVAASATITTPAQVPLLATDANGNLLLDKNGHVQVSGMTNFPGADVQVNYVSGAGDTVDWFVSYQGVGGLPPGQVIVLIR
jgi:hypothetical protein